MAKKQPDNGKNSITADEASSFVDEFEKFEDVIASKRGEFMNACKKIREQQKELLDDAKSQGVPKGVIKAIVKARDLDRKAKKAMDALDDDKDIAIDIRKALGDFADMPLGQAAVEREDGSAGIVAAVEADMTEEEKVRAQQARADF